LTGLGGERNGKEGKGKRALIYILNIDQWKREREREGETVRGREGGEINPAPV